MQKKSSFESRFSNIPSEIWSKIAKIDELKGRWTGGVNLSPQILKRLKISVLITSTGSSTRIEGSSLTDEEVEKLMQGLKVEKMINRDAQEARGYYELLQNVFNSWETIKLNESAIKHFHKELLKYAEKDKKHRGDYKKTENAVEIFDRNGKSLGIIFEPTKAYLTPKEMQELLDWTKKALAEKTIHPLLIIGNFIVEFLKIHPFQDGNGRLSRIVTNLLLLQAGYLYVPYVSHEKLVEDNKNNYYLTLRKSQKSLPSKKESIAPWLDFFLSIFLKQSEMAVKLLGSEQVEKLLSPKQLKIWMYLQSVIEAVPSEIAKKTGVARPTVNQALTKLLKLKKIEKIGEGRSTRYRKV